MAKINDSVYDRIQQKGAKAMEESINYEFYVAGVQFHELKHCIFEIEEGFELELESEPENKYDPNAVAIKYLAEDGQIYMIGYVPKKISASVAADLEINELVCEVVQLNPSAKPWEQIKVAITEA